MNKSKLMSEICTKLGKEQAMEMVMSAYNTELITTWLSRLEVNKPGLAAGTPHDHLGDALERVKEVCDLM